MACVQGKSQNVWNVEGLRGCSQARQIIEELSAGAEEQMEPLHERLHQLEEENGELKRQLDILRTSQASEDV